MQTRRAAFTLIEVLISIALLGIVVVALFSIVKTMRESNKQIYNYLIEAQKESRFIRVLYDDILYSDGNLSIKKGERTQLCIESTRNSLYGLSLAKVCWVVLKDHDTLVRVEGNDYHLPTRYEDRVEVDRVMKNVILFDVVQQADKVLVVLKRRAKSPVSFLIQGVAKPKPKPKPKKKRVVKRAGRPSSTTKPARGQPTKHTIPQTPKAPKGASHGSSL